jgi:hypothetical protein
MIGIRLNWVTFKGSKDYYPWVIKTKDSTLGLIP